LVDRAHDKQFCQLQWACALLGQVKFEEPGKEDDRAWANLDPVSKLNRLKEKN